MTSICKSAKHSLQLLFAGVLTLLSFALAVAQTPEIASEDVSRQQSAQQAEDARILEVESLLDSATQAAQENQYEEALLSLTQASRISESMNNTKLGKIVLNAMANIYYSTGQLDQAYRYYSELVVLDEANNNQQELSVSLFNLGHVLASQQNFSEAERIFERSLAFSRELGDDSGIAFTLKALGVNAQAQQQLDEAIDYLQESLQRFEVLENEMQTATVHRHLGDTTQEQGSFQQAVDHYLLALPVLTEFSFDTALLRTYRGLSTAYEQLGNYESSLIAQRGYTQLLQLQLQEQSTQATQRLQVEFEVGRFADANQRLEQENLGQLTELENSQSIVRLQYLAIGLALSLVLLLMVLWWRTRLFAKRMQSLATTDELTNLYNRRAITEFGTTEWQRAVRFKRPFTCLLMDIDHFKSVNDTLGHAAGDEVLRVLSACIKSCLRQTDTLGRFGGEEYLLLSAETNSEQAEILAERILKRVESTTFDKLLDRTTTISIGIAQMTTESSFEELAQHADQALYQAKNGGRNRYMLYAESG